MTEVQNVTAAESTQTHHRHDRWLALIGGFKLLKGLLFILLGIGALKLVHRDISDMLLRWLIDWHFDPESRFVNLVLDKAALIDAHRLKQISIAIFCYAGLDFIEGTGLVLEKTWAEYLTLILTASFLPWELYEIMRHPTWVKLVLTLVNVLVVVYLVFYVQRTLRERHKRRAAK
ncbi:DUF2127 domain-containing protein [Alloacidobacterium dinghuense]|uniref:DUF2127 domain-containing protein n=1 Tax=Alloacidobacterium dinghuense TaxID=2763107 RepID=A0A7G8BJA2_9BACT|nr:DUF2127 domain-containing protein [Alloacidobacterium dinghuense]QNI32622.1 DUF2127 domain-containing protein [Alloacidobacterium dinghuense]